MDEKEIIYIVSFVQYIPDDKDLKADVIYISNPYRIAVHLCPCGCQKKVVTPFNFAGNGWNLYYIDYKGLTIEPSILNKWCRSHYWIKDSKVIWCN